MLFPPLTWEKSPHMAGKVDPDHTINKGILPQLLKTGWITELYNTGIKTTVTLQITDTVLDEVAPDGNIPLYWVNKEYGFRLGLILRIMEDALGKKILLANGSRPIKRAVGETLTFTLITHPDLNDMHPGIITLDNKTFYVVAPAINTE